MATKHSAQRTTDHKEIRNWVEERGGQPAVVVDTREGDSGLLRIDFGEEDAKLERISWDDFFRIFDENDLTFLYQNKSADGSLSYFNKFVSRSDEEESDTETGDE